MVPGEGGSRELQLEAAAQEDRSGRHRGTLSWLLHLQGGMWRCMVQKYLPGQPNPVS